MFGFKLDIEGAKAKFFDRKKILDSTSRAERRALSRMGAFVRTKARDLLAKRRKRRSPPGQPPGLWTGLLRKFVFFSYEPSKKSVVIGPTLINGRTGRVPEVLEYGGTEQIEINGKRVAARYAGRPYMHPALEIEQKRLPGLLEGSVR